MAKPDYWDDFVDIKSRIKLNIVSPALSAWIKDGEDVKTEKTGKCVVTSGSFDKDADQDVYTSCSCLSKTCQPILLDEPSPTKRLSSQNSSGSKDSETDFSVELNEGRNMNNKTISRRSNPVRRRSVHRRWFPVFFAVIYVTLTFPNLVEGSSPSSLLQEHQHITINEASQSLHIQSNGTLTDRRTERDVYSLGNRGEVCPSGQVYHCIKDFTTGLLVEGCAKSMICQKGSYPQIFQDIKDQTKSVRCVMCDEDYYQPNVIENATITTEPCLPKLSTEMKEELPRMILIEQNGPFGPDKYACNTRKGYSNLYRQHLCDVTFPCKCTKSVQCSLGHGLELLPDGTCDSICIGERDPFDGFRCKGVHREKRGVFVELASFLVVLSMVLTYIMVIIRTKGNRVLFEDETTWTIFLNHGVEKKSEGEDFAHIANKDKFEYRGQQRNRRKRKSKNRNQNSYKPIKCDEGNKADNDYSNRTRESGNQKKNVKYERKKETNPVNEDKPCDEKDVTETDSHCMDNNHVLEDNGKLNRSKTHKTHNKDSCENSMEQLSEIKSSLANKIEIKVSEHEWSNEIMLENETERSKDVEDSGYDQSREDEDDFTTEDQTVPEQSRTRSLSLQEEHAGECQQESIAETDISTSCQKQNYIMQLAISNRDHYHNPDTYFRLGNVINENRKLREDVDQLCRTLKIVQERQEEFSTKSMEKVSCPIGNSTTKLSDTAVIYTRKPKEEKVGSLTEVIHSENKGETLDYPSYDGSSSVNSSDLYENQTCPGSDGSDSSLDIEDNPPNHRTYNSTDLEEQEELENQTPNHFIDLGMDNIFHKLTEQDNETSSEENNPSMLSLKEVKTNFQDLRDEKHSCLSDPNCLFEVSDESNETIKSEIDCKVDGSSGASGLNLDWPDSSTENVPEGNDLKCGEQNSYQLDYSIGDISSPEDDLVKQWKEVEEEETSHELSLPSFSCTSLSSGYPESGNDSNEELEFPFLIADRVYRADLVHMQTDTEQEFTDKSHELEDNGVHDKINDKTGQDPFTDEMKECIARYTTIRDELRNLLEARQPCQHVGNGSKLCTKDENLDSNYCTNEDTSNQLSDPHCDHLDQTKALNDDALDSRVCIISTEYVETRHEPLHITACYRDHDTKEGNQVFFLETDCFVHPEYLEWMLLKQLAMPLDSVWNICEYAYMLSPINVLCMRNCSTTSLIYSNNVKTFTLILTQEYDSSNEKPLKQISATDCMTGKSFESVCVHKALKYIRECELSFTHTILMKNDYTDIDAPFHVPGSTVMVRKRGVQKYIYEIKAQYLASIAPSSQKHVDDTVKKRQLLAESETNLHGTDQNPSFDRETRYGIIQRLEDAFSKEINKNRVKLKVTNLGRNKEKVLKKHRRKTRQRRLQKRKQQRKNDCTGELVETTESDDNLSYIYVKNSLEIANQSLDLISALRLSILNGVDHGIEDGELAQKQVRRENEKKEEDILKNVNSLLDDFNSPEFIRNLRSLRYFRPEPAFLKMFPGQHGLQEYFQQLANGPVSREESMRVELVRLSSLSAYTGNGSAVNLARHGFYHDPEHGPFATRCYACKVLYTTWDYFDDIQTIHRRLSPNCPHVRETDSLAGNRSTDNEVQSTEGAGSETRVETAGASNSDVPRQTVESVTGITYALQTTQIGDSNVPEGFPSQPTEDRDNSHFTRATPGISGTHRAAPVLSNVRTTTHGRARHTPPTDVNNTATGARSNESSTKVNTTTTSTSESSNQAGINTNTPTSGGPEKVRERAQGNGGFSTAAPRRDDPSRDEQLYGINNPSLVNVENPKHRDYQTIHSRTDSFTSLWPSYLDQTHRQMAEAGFFYAGVADFTRCFACGGGLRNWEAGDDPCLEHTRWYPRCEYMNKLKGSRYVDAVSRRQEQHLAEQRRRQQQQHEQRQQAQNRSSTPQDPLSTPAAAVLLEMGYSRERIREAITTVRRNTGHNSVSAEHALLWILDQDERQQSQNHTEASTASQSTTTSAATTGATASVSVSVSSSASAQSSSSSNASSSSSSNNATSSASSSASASVSSAQGQRSQGQGQSSASKKIGDKKGDDKKENKSEGKEPQRKGAEGEQPSSSKKKKNGKKKNKGGGTNSGNVGGANSNVGGANSSVGGSNGSNMGGANGSNVAGANADVGNEGGATGGGEAEERADSLSELREMDTQSLRAENQKLREMQTCKICMDKPVNMTLLPCGHLVCCESCVSHLRKCPICRKRIEGSVKTFMS